MILNRELKETTQTLLKLVKEFNKVTGYKTNI